MQYKPLFCCIFYIIGHNSCPKNAFRLIYIDIKAIDIGKRYAR